MWNASDIMTTEVITVTKDTPIQTLARILYEHHINGVPVVDAEGRLEGIVCETDLIRTDKKLRIPLVLTLFDATLFLESPGRFKKELKELQATTVEDLYTREVVTVKEDTPLDEIATMMTEKRAYTLPVLDDTGRVVGIIGKRDLIRTLAS